MLVRKVSLVMNLGIVAAVLVTWVRMMLAVGEGTVFTARGLGSLRYFTVLSNLLAAAASAVYGICLVRLTAGYMNAVPRGVVLLKYAGAVSVALTLLTVLLFLGPTAKDGFASMFLGVNLWFHLIVPVLAIADFCLLNPDGPLGMADSLWACLPMALYALYYLGNILRNGVEKNDWYGYLRGGIPIGAVIALATFLGTWGVALLMRLAHR